MKKLSILFILMLIFYSYGEKCFCQDTLSVKLEVNSKNSGDYREVKTYDKIIDACNLNLYAKSNITTHLYIIKSNVSQSALIKMEVLNPNSLYCIPFKFNSGILSDHSTKQTITLAVFCQENDLIEELFSSGPVSNEKWEVLEKNYSKNSLFNYIGNIEMPRIAGNMRSYDNIKLKNFFIDNYFIKKYSFYVKR